MNREDRAAVKCEAGEGMRSTYFHEMGSLDKCPVGCPTLITEGPCGANTGSYKSPSISVALTGHTTKRGDMPEIIVGIEIDDTIDQGSGITVTLMDLPYQARAWVKSIQVAMGVKMAGRRANSNPSQLLSD